MTTGTNLWAQYSDLFNFSLTTGQYPVGSLTLSGNLLFGMTTGGGTKDSGCVFSIHTDGSGYKDLLDFNGKNGYLPYYESLILSGNILYGMTSSGGVRDSGCIFSLDTNGNVFKDLHDFTLATGFYPTGGLTLQGNVLYGATQYGGTDPYGGVFFSIHTDGSKYKVLYNCSSSPMNTLVISGSKIYGLGGSGINIFSMDTDGTGYKDLHDFVNGAFSTDAMNWADGNSLILSGSKLYGTSMAGGTLNGSGYGPGFIFSIDTNGAGYKHIYDCTISPYTGEMGTLTLSGNLLYGLTYGAGVNDLGNIFSIDTSGSGYEDLVDFDSFSKPYGAHPYGSLISSGNVFYGMTQEGGGEYGVIFSYNTLLTSIQGLSETSGIMNIYPNPSTGKFQVTGIKSQVSNIEVYNLLGEKVFNSEIRTLPTDRQGEGSEIDFTNHPDGIYFIHVNTSEGTEVKKIIINK
jgi:uncharacterized repeat protein (TIGR03803 family)